VRQGRECRARGGGARALPLDSRLLCALLAQQDRGGLDADRAREVIAELPEH
jgi:hypothetical protein